jgi:hypothetical protein
MKRLSQLERIKIKLARDGSVSRNQCLNTYPAITRLGARIEDLEAKHGYVFRTENTGRDYVYHLVRIGAVPHYTRAARARMMKEAAENCAFFDNYQSA